jgi:hypothetical protein
MATKKKTCSGLQGKDHFFGSGPFKKGTSHALVCTMTDRGAKERSGDVTVEMRGIVHFCCRCLEGRDLGPV